MLYFFTATDCLYLTMSLCLCSFWYDQSLHWNRFHLYFLVTSPRSRSSVYVFMLMVNEFFKRLDSGKIEFDVLSSSHFDFEQLKSTKQLKALLFSQKSISIIIWLIYVLILSFRQQHFPTVYSNILSPPFHLS